MPENRIATFDAKHSKLPLPWLCIAADRSPKFPELIDVSADLPVTDSAGLCELWDCCALKKQGFCCAELLELCCERELCVGHLSFRKSRQPGLNRQKPVQLAEGCTGLARGLVGGPSR